MKIRQGYRYRCRRDIRKANGMLAYVEGGIYTSEHNECITDEQHDTWHFMVGPLVHILFEELPNEPLAKAEPTHDARETKEASGNMQDVVAEHHPGTAFYLLAGIVLGLVLTLLLPFCHLLSNL